MTLRPYRPDDAPALAAMLAAEGWPPDGGRFTTGATAVWDEGDGPRGFFTLELLDGWWHLRHFVIARAARSRVGRPALYLIRSAVRAARTAGASMLLVHAPTASLRRLIERYWHVMPAGPERKGLTPYRIVIGG